MFEECSQINARYSLPQADGKTGTLKKSGKLSFKLDKAEVLLCISSNLVFKVGTDSSRHFRNNHLIYKYVINPLVNENYRKSQESHQITACVKKLNWTIRTKQICLILKNHYPTLHELL